MQIPNQSTAARCILVATLIGSPLARPAQQPRERQVDLGGYKLFLSEEGSRLPCVVFESGLGEDVSTWSDVQPQIAHENCTITYDRAGLDKSDPSPKPRTVEAMASELHALLHAAEVPPPYILVGHSLGGALVQVFAHSYPSEVAGLVLVDPEDSRLLDRLRQHMTEAEWANRQKAIDSALGQFSATQKAELEGSRTNGDAVAAAVPLPDVPVVLLTGTKKDPNFPGNPLEQDLKLELHNELLATIPHGRHVLSPESRHYIQNEAPNLVIDAVREVNARYREAHSLTVGPHPGR